MPDARDKLCRSNKKISGKTRHGYWPFSTFLADIMPYDILVLKNENMRALRE